MEINMAYAIDPVNAAPKTIFLGTDDKSERALVATTAPRPTHLPLVFLWSEWGPTEPQVINGNTAKIMYGEQTFNLRSKWANHATLYANLFMSHANTMVVKRLLPANIGPKATIRLSIDVLETEMDVFKREIDGSYSVDAAGAFIPTGDKVSGFQVKWVKEAIQPDPTGVSGVGTGTIGVGDQTDPVSGDSKRYPIIDLEVPHFGSLGNRYGLSMYAPTSRSANPINSKFMGTDGVYPFRISMFRKTSETTTAKLIETQSAAQFVEFSFKEGVINTMDDAEAYIGDVLLDSYRNMTPSDPLAAPTYGPFERMHVYQDNIEEMLTKFFTAEAAATYADNNLFGLEVEANKHLFNFMSGVNSENVPYDTFRLADSLGTDGIRLTENTVMFASGATDGTVNDADFATLVGSEMEEIGDPNSMWNNTVELPMSFFYDSGFPLDIKRKCGHFISNLKNTVLVMSTHVAGEGALGADSENSRAISIRTALEAHPESIYFGTNACRAVIVGRHGKLINSAWKDYVGCNYELADKISAFAGASNGIWKASKLFDRTPTNYLTKMRDLNVTWTPVDVRNRDWAAGLMWPENIERRTPYFPATQTIYDDDTSTLNSLLMVMAVAECQTVGDRARMEYNGGNYSKADLKDRVETYIKENVKSRFCELFRIIPEVSFTAADEARGYSWTLTIKIYGNNMKTVQTLIIEAHRADELTNSTEGVLA